MGLSHFESLFNPKSVAVFGASESGNSVGSLVFSNILAGEFQGKAIPVNPKHGQVFGQVCHPSATDIPGEVDLAVIATRSSFRRASARPANRAKGWKQNSPTQPAVPESGSSDPTASAWYARRSA